MRSAPKFQAMRWFRLAFVVLAALICVACGELAEPPGLSVDSPAPSATLPLPIESAAPAPQLDPTELLPGRGDKLASIAMRTWIYLQPHDNSTKLGYLRAGAVVERARRHAGLQGCAGGWYAVKPRGYVCIGKGATLDLTHPVVRAVVHGPRRGEPMPYRYVMSRTPGPHLYFKLPSEKEQLRSEGQRRARTMARHSPAVRKRLGDAAELPAFLSGGDKLPVPYGSDKPLSYLVHRGEASGDSAFGLISHFEWTGRRMGLTSELDLIPLDRTKVAPLSKMAGVEIGPDEVGTPAFVIHHGVRTYELKDGRPVPVGDAPYRSGWVLTGRNNGSATSLLETTKGVWLPYAHLRIAKVREDPAGFARDGRKWIDVSIRKQILVAYLGKKPVYATLVSTGRGEMGDPETTHATVRGTFMIHAKHIAATMDGDDEAAESFDLRDVPYIQYFYKGYALHGAYWHDDFGKVRSHGCVNLAPTDAAWLFDWTEPEVPAGWHGALNHQAGTLVYTHG